VLSSRVSLRFRKADEKVEAHVEHFDNDENRERNGGCVFRHFVREHLAADLRELRRAGVEVSLREV